ncbi:hypothetical protein JBL43_03365 [Aureibaculum sp. A20]|uniref:Lipocalin-like domain-containing protein n=1 Tax=Aureibaculum flavum TaxID=2795986 RepID=A0ABS0WMR8_9FLAO|nr:hypothetical protein [Aureibaculum flavum]MBJ2173258.1 hypothetical protein [Aureibaculum flavum]
MNRYNGMRTIIIIYFLLMFFNTYSQENNRNDLIGSWTYAGYNLIGSYCGCIRETEESKCDEVFQVEFYTSGDFRVVNQKKGELTQREKFGLWVLFEGDQLKMKIDDEEIIFKIEIKNKKLYLSTNCAQAEFIKSEK